MIKLGKIIILLLICMKITFLGVTVDAAEYRYDDLGRVIEVTYDSGQKIVYTYDAGGNLLSVEEVSLIKLNPIGNKIVLVGEELRFTVTGVGEEGELFAYTAYNLPKGAKINSQTGVFSWTPALGQAGEYPEITFRVTNGMNALEQKITITVKGKATKGDIDGNGLFDSIDFVYMKLYLMGVKKDLTKEQLEAADVDNNGLVDSNDFAIMRQVILRIKPSF